MCKIIKYWFSCQHGFRPKGSRCGGTKHKRLRSGKAAACKSESYLDIVIPIDCGPCQYEAFEDGWKRKLSSAKTFLEAIKEKDFPGVPEVAALVEQLEEESNTASWNTRNLFPHMHKERKKRVDLGHFDRKPSPLRQEVLPKDVPEATEVIHPEHPDYEYDWDYVASTDPIHPVDTNYAHPLDDVDPSWMLNHLSPEEFEESGSGVGFDANEMDKMWTDNLEEPDTTTPSWDEGVSDWEPDTAATTSAQHDTGWGAKVATPSTSSNTRSDSTPEVERMRKTHIEMVIHEFWTVVNEEDPCDQSRLETMSPLSEDLTARLNGLDISEASDPSLGLITSPPTPPNLPADESCDEVSQSSTPSTIPPSQISALKHVVPPDTTPSERPAQSPHMTPSCSTRTLYDKWRRHLNDTKDVDRIKFNQDLLLLLRCEIRDLEGPTGRFIQDPQLLRNGNANMGV